MYGDSERPYETFLSSEERSLIWDTYISSVSPNWTLTPFPMGNLPRELRDNVWDHTLLEEGHDISAQVRLREDCKDRDSVVDGDDGPQQANDAMDLDEGLPSRSKEPVGLKASVRWMAAPNVLNTSASVKKECEERANHCKTLVLQDSDLYSFQHVVLPPAFTSVLWLEICLILFCHSCPFMNHESEGNCRATAEISRHKSWIEDVLEQLPQLRAFSVFVHLAHSDFVLGQKTKLPCEDLVELKLRVLKEMPKLKELVLYRYKFDDYMHLDGPKDLVSRWKPEPVERVDRAGLQ